MPMKIENPPTLEIAGKEIVPKKPLSLSRLALVFGVAAASDFLSIWAELVPPVQWVLDVATAGALFMVLGRRWALLPGLVAEAIPGMGVFPIWILVVLSVVLYDEIKAHRK
jgi:hypothetical protein